MHYRNQVMKAADLTPLASIAEFGLQIGQTDLGLSRVDHASDQVEAVPLCPVI